MTNIPLISFFFGVIAFALALSADVGWLGAMWGIIGTLIVGFGFMFGLLNDKIK